MEIKTNACNKSKYPLKDHCLLLICLIFIINYSTELFPTCTINGARKHSYVSKFVYKKLNETFAFFLHISPWPFVFGLNSECIMLLVFPITKIERQGKNGYAS